MRRKDGGIAQLARAFGSYPECRRFESHCRYQFYNKECRITCPPLSYIRPGGQAVKTPPFHGGNTGSSPVRVTKKEKLLRSFSFFYPLRKQWHIIPRQRAYHQQRLDVVVSHRTVGVYHCRLDDIQCFAYPSKLKIYPITWFSQ